MMWQKVCFVLVFSLSLHLLGMLITILVSRTRVKEKKALEDFIRTTLIAVYIFGTGLWDPVKKFAWDQLAITFGAARGHTESVWVIVVSVVFAALVCPLFILRVMPRLLPGFWTQWRDAVYANEKTDGEDGEEEPGPQEDEPSTGIPPEGGSL
ncbi:hypothetical protein [Bifidobacterium favimelis]|uniref:Uncharacterized protein n=1 Tax=Bifidobacterium favimelis TaxID=3122979 RepID=A0ABU8ZL02_9BIFI